MNKEFKKAASANDNSAPEVVLQETGVYALYLVTTAARAEANKKTIPFKALLGPYKKA